MVSVDSTITSPVLIGRSAIVDSLHRYFDAVKSGQSQTILISGEAGIGKSRLIREALRYASALGYLIVQGSCFPNDVHCPYAPVLDLLRVSLANAPEDRNFLAQEHFPLLPELVPISPHMSSHLHPEQEKRRLFAILTQLFTRKATHQPVLCVIEDVHWSDDVSLGFLHYLARHCATHPLLLLVTYRSDEVQPALKHWLVQLDRERLAHELPLHRLTRADVETMLTTIFEPTRPLRTDFVDTIYGLTEGNPFFIEEVLKSLPNVSEALFGGSERHLSLNTLHIPRSVQAAVQGRFEHLSAPARHLVTLAAVIGRQFDFELLRKLTRFEEDDLLRTIKELIAAQLIVERSSDQFAFRHALTRQTIYAALLARERKPLHHQIGEMIEQIHTASPEPYAAELAYHYYAAGIWDKTLKYARSAGEQARRLYALNAAVEHFTHALDAARQVDNAPLGDLHAQRGQVYELLGEFEYARHDLEVALDLARVAQDHAAEWENLLALGFLWASRDYVQTGDYYRQALTLAQTIDDPPALARTLNRLGNWHANAEQPSEAQRYHHEALDIFENLDDPLGLAETFDLLGMAYFLGGDLFQCEAYLNLAAAHFNTLNYRPGLVSSLTAGALVGLSLHIDTLVWTSTPIEMLVQKTETALQLARESGLRSGEVFALSIGAYLVGGQGDYARALALLEQGLVVAEEIGHRQWVVLVRFCMGLTLTDVFALDDAQNHLEVALQLAHESGSLYWRRSVSGCLALVYIMQNRYAEAEATLDRAIEDHTPAQTIAQRMCWRARAELALARNDGHTALKITDLLTATALNLDKSEYAFPARVNLLRGESLLQLRQFKAAEAALLPLMEFLRHCGANPLLWRAQTALGKVYLAQRKRDQAEDAFETARFITTSLAENLPDKALRDNFLTHVNTRIPQKPLRSPHQIAKKAFGGLTAREREIAGYIVQGKSNREIGDRLVISERTAEAHVSNILNKLGFNSRAQIAAWATEKGLHREDKGSNLTG